MLSVGDFLRKNDRLWLEPGADKFPFPWMPLLTQLSTFIVQRVRETQSFHS